MNSIEREMFNKITIVGMGLIGGSVGMACRQRGLTKKVTAVVRRTSAIDEVLDHNAADEVFLDIPEGVTAADLVIMATPVESMPALTRKAKASLSARCIVTDVGSVKRSVVSQMERLLKSTCRFVGVHPMAGSEKSGIAIASPTLFDEAICIITPTESSSTAAVRKVRKFWEALGCRVVYLTPVQHDTSIALVSHLPHVVASCVVTAIARRSQKPLSTMKLAGQGFKDTTRIAAGSPDLWAGICIENKDAILRSLRGFADEIAEFTDLLEHKDRQGLRDFLHRAKELKDRSTDPSN
jgi:prephenate dehydrogenase